jgi:hypothetical protein
VSVFRDWADHPSEAGKPNGHAIDRKPKRIFREDAPAELEAEGPPACCSKRRVAADALVWFGGLPPGLLSRVRARFPRLQAVAAADYYLCDGCREIVRRERLLARSELPSWRNDPESRRYKEKKAKGQAP